MKAILISLLLIVATQVKAQDVQGIWQGQDGDAPIFANLKMSSLSRNMSAVNSLISFENGAHVTFNSKQVTLNITPAMPVCPKGSFCVQMMPAPIETTLEVVKIENTGCSTKYYAQTPANLKTTVYEQVIIDDYTYSVCEMVYVAPGKVKYTATGLSQLSQQTETATATFTIPEFVRAVN